MATKYKIIGHEKLGFSLLQWCGGKWLGHWEIEGRFKTEDAALAAMKRIADIPVQVKYYDQFGHEDYGY